jgi:NAD-dependent deacetylase
MIESSTPSNIVILTGAGISRESGLDTFRDTDGIWASVNIDDVATPEGFARNPERVHKFYNSLRNRLLADTVRPNAAHLALAKLEQEWNGRVLLITQNVDDLHERAGSINLIHMHGELLKARCNSCLRVMPCRQDLSVMTICTRCGSSGSMRPHVVWFGEIPMARSEINQALKECGIFIAIGTSGNVYPAAGFVEVARLAHARTIELSLEPSVGASRFHQRMYGPATEVVTKYVESFLRDNRKAGGAA